MILIGLLRLLQALSLKLLPLCAAGVAALSYWPDQNALAFVLLGFAWWILGPKFGGGAGVRWRAWLSAVLFCVAIFVSGYLFIDYWHLSWARLWILLLTGATLAATHQRVKPNASTIAQPVAGQAAAMPVGNPSSSSRVFLYFSKGSLLGLAVFCLLVGISFLDQSISAVVEPAAQTRGPREALEAGLRMAQERNAMNFAIGVSLLAVGLLGLNRSLRGARATEGPIDRLMTHLGSVAWPAAPVFLFAVASLWLGYQSLVHTRFHFTAPAAVEAFKDVSGDDLNVTGNLMYGVTFYGKLSHVAYFSPTLVRALDRAGKYVGGSVRPHEHPLPGLLPIAAILILALFAAHRTARRDRLAGASDIIAARVLLFFGLINLYVLVWLISGKMGILYGQDELHPDWAGPVILLLVSAITFLLIVRGKVEAARLPLTARFGWLSMYFAINLGAVAWSYGLSYPAEGSPVFLWVLCYLAAGALCWLTIRPKTSEGERTVP